VGRLRAVVVATGSELVRGEIRDANGGFLASEAVRLGFDVARILVVGDRPDDLRAALAEGLAAPLCLISGGLGPTHDDRTVELVAAVAGLDLELRPELEEAIGAISRDFARRRGRDYVEFEPGVRKQATLPAGAVSLGLAGTAPGFVLPTEAGAVVVLPGPPGELRRLWPRALETEEFRAVQARTEPVERRVLRFFGIGESSVAKVFADAGGDGDGCEVTICARDFEIHVDLLVSSGGEPRADALEAALTTELAAHLFARGDDPVEQLVLDGCVARGVRLATAESCTGGLVSALITALPGSSEAFAGSVVSYANDVKREVLGVPQELLDTVGAVSPEVARAMAEGVRDRLGAEVAVSVTGVAGPGGGSEQKPVGLVYFHALAPWGEEALRIEGAADRETVRRRAAKSALHLVRRLLEQNRHSSV
jgi:nicotinamide-nucleotide amidase